jgi:Skp family chaperone for outer membrane proteins
MLRLILIACCLGSAVGEVKSSGPIGVVNLDEVFRAAKMFAGALDQIKAEQAKADQQFAAFDEQEKQLKNALEVINPGNDRYAKAQEDLEVLRARRKVFIDSYQGRRDQKYAALLREGYQTMRAHLKDYAKENQLKLVFLAPQSDIPEKRKGAKMQDYIQDLQMTVSFQSVLYYEDSIDITKGFLSYLNSRFSEPVQPVAPDNGESKDKADVPAPAPSP